MAGQRSAIPAAISAPHTTGLWSFLHNDYAPGLAYRRANRLPINRGQASHVDHFGIQFVRRLHGVMDHQQPREHRYTASLPSYRGLVEGDDVVLARNLARGVHRPGSARAPFEPYRSLCSKIRTGLPSRTAALSSPLAS